MRLEHSINTLLATKKRTVPNQSKHQQEISTTCNGIKIIKPLIGLESPKEEIGKYRDKLNAILTQQMPHPLPMASLWCTLRRGHQRSGLFLWTGLDAVSPSRKTTLEAAKFSLARRQLDGAAKTDFKNTAQLCGGTTINAIFQECLKEVTADFFLLSPWSTRNNSCIVS